MAAKIMIPIILFVFVFRLLLERLLKSYGPHSFLWLAINSVLILSPALYIVLSHKYSAQDVAWAYVSVGIVLGLWLRNPRQKPASAVRHK